MMNISNTQINKDRLEDYLSDFHPIKIGELRLKFKDFNFNIGTTSFLNTRKVFRIFKN